MDIYEKIKRRGDNAFERAMRMYGIKPKEAEKIFKSTDWANVDNGGGSGGGELEGEYFLAKPNGRYWKFTFMPEGDHLRIENFEPSQIEVMSQVYDFLLKLQNVYGAAVSSDDIGYDTEYLRLDGFYNIGVRMNGTFKAIKNYKNGYEYNKVYFNEGFLRVWKEADIKSNPPAELDFGGVVLPPCSNLVEFVKRVCAIGQGIELTDDEAISFIEQMFMLIPATEEEYKRWRFEDEDY